MSLVMQGPAAVAFALLLNQNMRGRSLIRVLIFVPYVISEVIVGTGWGLMLQYTGAVNDLLTKMGLGAFAHDWIADPNIAIWSLMVIISWKYIGFAVILFLAGHPEHPRGAVRGRGDRRRLLLADPAAHHACRCSARRIRIWAFLSIIGSLQLFDLVYIIWGQYVAVHRGDLDDGDLHGA